MTRFLTVSAPLVTPQSGTRLAPGAVSVLWEISTALDRRDIPPDASNAVWLQMPAARLRGPAGRNDNQDLREWLSALTGIQISGSFRDPETGDVSHWGAVLVAEWHLEEDGSQVRILVPPAAIYAIRAPGTFAKVESHAAWSLSGHARRLYGLLADRRNMRQQHWTWDVEQLKQLLDVHQRQSYARWDNFRSRVLLPAIAAINDYGTVVVTMTPIRRGRRIAEVRFDWRWKSFDEARFTAEEGDRHTITRGRIQSSTDAPPLVETPTPGKIWPKVRERVTELRGREAHGWLREVVTERVGDTGVILLAPSELAANHIEETYGRLIRELWSTHDPDAVVSIDRDL